MSEHTPGPWVADGKCSGRPPDAGVGVIASDTEPAISNPSRGIVAYACRLVSRTSAEVEANARLIAAAPVLLQVLREVESIMSIVEPRSDKAEYLTGVARVRAAIAKATGVPLSSADRTGK